MYLIVYIYIHIARERERKGSTYVYIPGYSNKPEISVQKGISGKAPTTPELPCFREVSADLPLSAKMAQISSYGVLCA